MLWSWLYRVKRGAIEWITPIFEFKSGSTHHSNPDAPTLPYFLFRLLQTCSELFNFLGRNAGTLAFVPLLEPNYLKITIIYQLGY